MAERETETDRAPEAPAAADTRPGRRSRSLGRGIATSIVVAGLVYLCGVGFYSVIPQVFWPERGEAPEGLSCRDGLTDLRGELLSRAGDRVASGGGGAESLTRWLDDWDRRHLALEARCDGERHDAWQVLGRLRQRLQGTLERFDAEEGGFARDMDSRLATFGQ
ncbi:MAG: hypothetical protein RLO52_32560 [Sandaracinaceae bacterium]